MMTRKWSWLGLTAAVCVVGGLWMGSNCGSGLAAENVPQATSAPATPPGHIIEGIFTPVESFEVRIRPRRFHDDLVINKAVAPGSKVARGDVLLELHRQAIDEQITLARNDVAIAEANLAKACSDVRLGQQGDDLAMTGAKNDLANAQASLKRWDDIDGANFLLSSGLDVKRSDFELQNRTDELDQLRKMYKSEDLTNQTADIVMKQAMAGLDFQKIADQIAHVTDQRKQQMEAPQRRQSLATAAAQAQQALAQLQATQSQGKTLRQTAAVAAQCALDLARQKLADLTADHAAFVVTSPISGVVEYGSFDDGKWSAVDPSHLAPGEKVQPDQVLMTVYTPGKMQVVMELPESRIMAMSLGMKVRVEPTALLGNGIAFEGKCSRISTIGRSKPNGQVFDVVIDLPSVDKRLAPGFSAWIDLPESSISTTQP